MNVMSRPDAPVQRRVDKAMPAVLLVGGFGTRLQSAVPLTAKPLARVGGTPFLELLVLQLRAQGIRRLVMSTGHLAEQIQEHFRDGQKWDVDIAYSRENEPLGTGGALKFAEKHIGQAPDVLVMNGDSFLEIDFGKLIRFHHARKSVVTMAACRVPDARRYGTLDLDKENRVVRFVEKTGTKTPGLINAGVYVFSRAALQHIPDGRSSLEKDLFPRLLESGMYAIEQEGMFIDIGTPEDYAHAQELSRNLHHAVRGLGGGQGQNL